MILTTFKLIRKVYNTHTYKNENLRLKRNSAMFELLFKRGQWDNPNAAITLPLFWC